MPAPRPRSPLSRREKKLAGARERRAAKVTRREDMLEDIVSGCDYRVIANKNNLSIKTVRREVDRALDQRPLASVDRYVRVQVERLTKALQTIDRAIEQGEIQAVDPLLKVIEKLDRYHGLAGVRSSESALVQPRLPAPIAPLALTHEGTETTA